MLEKVVVAGDGGWSAGVILGQSDSGLDLEGKEREGMLLLVEKVGRVMEKVDQVLTEKVDPVMKEVDSVGEGRGWG